MKKILCAVILFFILHPVVAADLLVSDKPFSENGIVTTGNGEKIEQGTLNSVHYLIHYSDGKAYFGNEANPDDRWIVTCKKYTESNDVHCPIRKKGLSVYIYASGDNGVSIGPNIYPKSSASITIDSDKPLMTKKGKKGVFDEKTGKEIIQKLSSTSQVSITFAQWPKKKPFTQAIDMTGYDEAVKYARWAMLYLQEAKVSY